MSVHPFPYEYRVNSQDGEPQMIFFYDSSGKIGSVFTYNPHLDAMVMTDVWVFERAFSKAFKKAEEAIYEIVTDKDFISSRKHG